jgi:O-antigen ligase
MKKALEVLALGALFIIPFLPLYVEPAFFFPFITGKNFAFRVLVEIAAFSTLLLMMLDKSYRPRFSWTGAILTLLVGWMFIADLFGINPHKAFWSNFERMDGWVTLVHLLLLFVTTSVLFKQADHKRLTPSVIAWGGAVLFWFGLFANFAITKSYQSMLGKFFLIDLPVALLIFAGFIIVVRAIARTRSVWQQWWLLYIAGSLLTIIFAYFQVNRYFTINQGGVRVDATLGNAIYFAVYLLFAFFIALWLSREYTGVTRKVLYGSAALSAVFLMMTATRGAFVALIFGAFCALMYYAFTNRTHILKNHRNKVIAVVVAVCVLFGAYLMARDIPAVKNHPILGRLTSITLHDLSTRTTLWGIAVRGAADQPITGWGQDGFNHVFNKYYEPSMYLQEAWFDRVHNTYLDWLVAGGVPALTLFIALLIAACYSVVRYTTSRSEKMMLLGALLAYALQAITVFDNLFSYIPFIMIIAMAHSKRQKDILALQKLPEVKGKDLTVALTIVVTIIGGVTLWVVNGNNALASAKMIAAIRGNLPPATSLSLFKEVFASKPFAQQEASEHLIMFTVDQTKMQSADEQTRAAFFTEALARIDNELVRAQGDARLQLQKLALYSSKSDLDNALKVIDAAVEKSPRKQQILIEKGNIHWRRNEFDKAREAYRFAYSLDTQFAGIGLFAAVGDILVGQVAEGKALLQSLYGTTAVDSDQLVLAYYQAKSFNDVVEIMKMRAETKTGQAQLQAMVQYALILAEVGRKAEARVVADSMANLSVDAAPFVEQLKQQIDATKVVQ